MSIDPKKCCGTHSKEKEDNGECCQTEAQERAEALTYEQSFVNKSHFVIDSPQPKDTNE